MVPKERRSGCASATATATAAGAPSARDPEETEERADLGLRGWEGEPERSVVEHSSNAAARLGAVLAGAVSGALTQ